MVAVIQTERALLFSTALWADLRLVAGGTLSREPPCGVFGEGSKQSRLRT